jgi:SAM-dependent methyltransferase
VNTQDPSNIRKAVRDRYGAIARGSAVGCAPSAEGPCCSPDATEADSPSLALGYEGDELSALPPGADLGLGCGNPGAIASLEEGATVVDLGSGGGIDCFLAGRQVGPHGRIIGVDMTPDMIERARSNAAAVHAANVEFRLGEIENLPVADASADVVLSNCVINLSPDQGRVYLEAFRVLKPGGRLAISDMVAKTDLPAAIREDVALHTGCIAGAATREEIERHLTKAGFEDVRVRPRDGIVLDESTPTRPEDAVYSAMIEGRKPVTS